MKQGMDLVEMANEIKRREESKRDFIAPQSKLQMTLESETPVVSVAERPENDLPMPPPARPKLRVGDEVFGINDVAHGQIAGRLGIPSRYYKRMQAEAPALLAGNVNHWFQQNGNDNRMIRTLDGRARAYLSDRYRPLDNFALANAVLPILMGEQSMELRSCNLTDTRMYIKATLPRIQAEVRVGDIVEIGIQVSNSEVGCGALRVVPLFLRLWCMNGATMNEAGMRKYHIGKVFGNGNGDSDEAVEFFSNETLAAADKAFFMKVHDTVRGVLSQEVLDKYVEKLQKATEDEITRKVSDEKFVLDVTKRFDLTQEEGTTALDHLIRDGDFTRYGLMNAITRTSQDVDDYDRATDLEAIGGQVIELSSSQWKELAA